MQTINNYCNPFSSHFRQSVEDYKSLSLPRKVATVAAAIFGAIATPYLLCVGGVALFQLAVKWLKPGEIASADKTSNHTQNTNQINLSPEEFIYRLDNGETLPNNVRVNGSLNLAHRLEPYSLPNKLHVTGNLILQGCMELRALPERLRVDGTLNICYCRQLLYFPNKLYVGKQFLAQACHGLERLPDEFYVGQTIYLPQCRNLREIPEGLRVNGDLILDETGLIRTPTRLYVKGSLSLRICPYLQELSPDLQLGGDLILTSCSSLDNFPNELLQLGAKSDGQIRSIYLLGTALSQDRLDELNSSPHAGIEFVLGRMAEEQ